MFTKNGNILKINGDWIKPSGSPVPPGPQPSGQWYDLGEYTYSNFSVDSSTYYRFHDDNIETSGAYTGTPTYSFTKLYKTLLIPNERKEDDYLLFEIPMRPFRSSNKASIISSRPKQCNIKFNVRKSNSASFNNLDCEVYSEAQGSKWEPADSDYGVSRWYHLLNDNNGDELDNVQVNESDDYTRKVRLLYNLNTSNLYIQWGTNLTDEVKLSDYYNLGIIEGGFGTGDYYTINIFATGYGYMPNEDNDYLCSGYVSNSTDCQIKLKSYKGTL